MQRKDPDKEKKIIRPEPPWQVLLPDKGFEKILKKRSLAIRLRKKGFFFSFFFFLSQGQFTHDVINYNAICHAAGDNCV